MYEYPQNLVSWLAEQDAEGAEIFTTHSMDGTVFIVKHKDLDGWLTVAEWYEGQDDFQLVNICEKAFDRLFTVMAEVLDVAVIVNND